jgi:Tfp pilus assembly PilM family ATPase
MSLFSAFSLAAAPPPGAAAEISAHQVSAAAIDSRGGRTAVAAQAVEPLPEGALVASLTAHNARDRAAVIAALKQVLEQVGRPKRIGLVLPDPVAKVSLVKFAQVPSRAQDLDQLVRWQVRKAAPFPIEEAQVSYVPGLRGSDGQEFLVTLARRDVIVEYEEICAAAGAHAGLVDISTVNIANAVLAADAAPPSSGDDWLLVNMAADYASIAVVRGPHIILFRSRGADADGSLTDLVHQTAMYYEDRLEGAGFSRVLLSGVWSAGLRQTGDVEQIRRSLEDRLGKKVDTVDPRGAVSLTDRISVAPAYLDTLAPLIGLLLRDKARAAA